MMKPRSIQLFDRFYLGALAVSLVSTIVYWDETVETTLSEPGMPFGAGFILFITAAGFAISLLLWFLVSVRASKVAKWILAVLFGFGAVMYVIGFASGAPENGFPLLIGLVSMLLQAASVWMLFRPDANAWFSGRAVNPAIFE